MQDGVRRRREDHEELDGLLEEAIEALERGDLCGAQNALESAGLKATAMWGGADQLAPGYTGKLIDLLWEVQKDLGHLGQNSPEALRKDLRELRSRFKLEARRDARKIDDRPP